MSYTQGKAGIIKRRYNVYLRATAAYTAPTDLSGVTTLLGTGTQIGELRDKTLKMKLVVNEKVELNDGTKKALDWIGTLELEDVNVTAANITQIETSFDNVDCDIILDDPTNEQLIVIKDTTLDVEENENSGDLSSLMMKTEKLVSAKSSFRERTDYSAFS